MTLSEKFPGLMQLDGDLHDSEEEEQLKATAAEV
jgi:hypothetical protein